MDFIYKQKGTELILVHMSVEQDLKMWQKGYITLHRKGGFVMLKWKS